MTQQNAARGSRICRRSAVAFSAMALLLFLATRMNADDKTPQPWVAPAAARMVKNPLKKAPAVVAAGAESFRENCQVCHGPHGEGNGPTAQTLTIKPANFADAKVMSKETDGSLYWKMSKGRGAMPAWEDQLSETERWQLVIYIRTFQSGGAGTTKKSE